MKLYKARPAVVEVVEWTGENHDEVAEMLEIPPGNVEFLPRGAFAVREATGITRLMTNGGFHATYEPVL